MSSIAKSKMRSKKTKRLWPVQAIRADQYEAFDVDSKVECISALIPLGLMHVQEALEEEVCTLSKKQVKISSESEEDERDSDAL